MADAAVLNVPLIGGNKSPADVTRDVVGALDARPSALWWGGLALSSTALLAGHGCHRVSDRRPASAPGA